MLLGRGRDFSTRPNTLKLFFKKGKKETPDPLSTGKPGQQQQSIQGQSLDSLGDRKRVFLRFFFHFGEICVLFVSINYFLIVFVVLHLFFAVFLCFCLLLLGFFAGVLRFGAFFEGPCCIAHPPALVQRAVAHEQQLAAVARQGHAAAALLFLEAEEGHRRRQLEAERGTDMAVVAQVTCLRCSRGPQNLGLC